jgi:hypothetical protein
VFVRDFLPDFKLISEYIWISGYSVYVGFKSTSISEKEYRFLINNMLFQLDSESIFEMLDDYPQFILGTSIRGEGKMACPVLFNLIKLEDIKGIRREHIKEYIKDKMKMKKSNKEIMKKSAFSKEMNTNDKDQDSFKGIKLKGSLKFVMDYVERYKKIKILEEEGMKGVRKIQPFLEEDSTMVISSKARGQFYLVDKMKILERSLLKKRENTVLKFYSN